MTLVKVEYTSQPKDEVVAALENALQGASSTGEVPREDNTALLVCSESGLGYSSQSII